jgi:Holliday junction resolvasome RuvABC DNA-binding subunit
MEFITLSPAEQLRWRKQVEPVEKQLITQLEKLGYPAQELVQAIKNSAKKYSHKTSDELMQETLTHPFTNLLP